MSNTVISVENISKSYRLGVIGTGTFFGDLNRWWARKLGKPDPYAKIGEVDHGNRYGESILALNNVDFKVMQGEALGIIGRNGAGKSTLLKILSQVTAPTTGVIKVKGRIASLLEVGTGFHPELTGRENIFLNGAILGMNRREVEYKLDEIVDFSGVENYIDTPVKRYSSGMYVRLAFAVSAHLEPDILVVDEVLAVGDAEFQKKCLGKMGEVTNSGRTVLFVSHNMAAVQAICSKVFLLSRGELILSGDKDYVIGQYLDNAPRIAQQDLKNRTDRTGSQRLRFTKVSFEGQDGGMIQEMSSGREYTIVLDYESDGGLENVSVSIGVYGNYGQFLLMCNNEMTGVHFGKLPSCGQLRCTLTKLPFAQGVYNINLYCEVKGILADWVQEAATFSVVEGDYYGTGKISPSSHGGFLAPQIWSHTSEK